MALIHLCYLHTLIAEKLGAAPLPPNQLVDELVTADNPTVTPAGVFGALRHMVAKGLVTGLKDDVGCLTLSGRGALALLHTRQRISSWHRDFEQDHYRLPREVFAKSCQNFCTDYAHAEKRVLKMTTELGLAHETRRGLENKLIEAITAADKVKEILASRVVGRRAKAARAASMVRTKLQSLHLRIKRLDHLHAPT